MPPHARPAVMAVAATATISVVLAFGVTAAVASGFKHGPASHARAGAYVAKETSSGTTPRLSVLNLAQSVNDTAWATIPSGALYTTDDSADAVDMVMGPFPIGMTFVSVTPCSANNAPSTCPSPPNFPPNYLGTEDLATGLVTPLTVTGVAVQPNGLFFAPIPPPGH
ncbi:MAG TPA: hypothetical protein VGS19_28695 [Streptosporangiaceae bacterium]|nr:hypothetical protein [Streptosporangiaceae bacterium]